MFILDQCATLRPVINLIKHGVIPLVQIVIIVALIIFLITDFGKAVMAGKEDEIKSAQKLAIKRVVYAVIVFLVPWLVNVAMGLLVNADSPETGNPSGEAKTAWQCYAEN